MRKIYTGNRKKSRTHLMQIAVTVIAGIAALTYLNAYVAHNDIPPVFGSGEARTMEELTIEGTSDFLQSNADVFMLLSEVEVGYGGNSQFNRSIELTEAAISKLERSRQKYLELIGKAESSAYAPDMIKALKKFNYRKLVESNRLNQQIMATVKGYLTNGDVRGLYRRHIESIDVILGDLYDVRTQLKEGNLPVIDTFWSLLHEYSEALLVGNYATMVFVNL
jgi:hypothetical protein